MLGHFLKIPPLKKILEFQGWKKTMKKENVKSEIKPIIENLQDELYQLENKQTKGSKLDANMRWELDGEKGSKTFFKVLEKQNLQKQTLFELYTDDKK